MKRVCLLNFPPLGDFHGYHIETFDHLSYFGKYEHSGWDELVRGGANAFFKQRGMQNNAETVDRLYREREPSYMRMMRDFVDRFHDFDLIIMAHNNFLHPEILFHELKKPIKVLGFIDDPYSTYIRGIPYLWAYDGAFHISPSYDERTLFEEALEKWGCNHHLWWPLVFFPSEYREPTQEFFENRYVDMAYVGNPTLGKVDRLIKLKRHFSTRFEVYGRWRFNGYAGIVRGMFGKPIYWHRVRSISSRELTNLYRGMKIGFNMHVSEVPRETGNLRMYDVPAHGAMLLCDKAGRDAHNRIFKDGVEAVYYDSIEHAIELAEYYLHNPKKRIEIARAGFERFWRDYNWEKNLLRLLDWGWGLRSIRNSKNSTLPEPAK